MRKTSSIPSFVFALLLVSINICSQNYTFDTLVTGIREPSAFTFLPNGNIIVTQKHDSAKIYSLNNQLISCFWNFYDSCVSNGERGLIGVCLDPNYAVNRYIYFYYTHSTSHLYRVIRLTENNNVGINPKIIFSDSSGTQGVVHVAGNLKFGSDNKLYISIGDNGTDANAQNLRNFKGKILRLNSDGTIPADNPFYDDGNPKTGNDDRIWVYGLRNSYDFVISPFNDSIYATENGGFANDEINFIKKGKNYGWPVCQGYCVPYNPLYKQPMDTIGGTGAQNYAPTGILIYNGNQFPELYGKLIVTGFGSGPVQGTLKFNLGNPPFLDTITTYSVISPLRTCTSIIQGPDGFIYFAKFANFNGMIFRMKYDITGVNNQQTPLKFELDQNFPNPFNPETTVKFTVPKSSFVMLQIFDVLGRELVRPVSENKSAGTYEVKWNAENYPSGVYFYRLTAGEFSEERKMVLKK
ncbi:MAG TPA: PQQ-dependent sugar dehydrogenase [Ignavibacteria bacterium]|nr:PQQ-dependent sugar dehydrogenase [Ignavibacteria bacterium]